MAIVNRDLDSTQQIDVMVGQASSVATGATYCMAVVPYPSRLISASLVAAGLSGSPNCSLWLQRMVPGVGITSICLGASLVAQVFGTSGAQEFTIQGGVTYPLQEGDALLLATAAANTGANHVAVSLCVQALQDIKSYFGATP